MTAIEKLAVGRRALRAVGLTIALCGSLFAAAPFAAEPSRSPPDDSQEASPAVEGEALENLNRGDPPPAQAAAPAATGRDQAASPKPRASADRLELDTTVVTGNRELPKVLYIVPWKKADMGELPAQPFNTLLDEVLTPVDRDVFRREVTYFDAATGRSDANQSTSEPQR